MLLPFHGVTYYATAGSGAFKESSARNERLHASSETDFSKMYMAVSRNHPSPKIRNVFRSLGLAGELNRGSVGLKIGLIAERACDLYIHLSPRTKLWDTCAPQVILEEAGGRLTDLFGEEFQYDIEDLQNHVLTQYFMLTFTYNLRNFGTGVQRPQNNRGNWMMDHR